MKNCKSYLLLLLMLLCVLGTSARTSVKHYLGVWGEVGEWTLLPQKSDLSNSLGGAGAVGFAYELQANHFLFNLGVGGKAGYTVFDVGNMLPQTMNNIDQAAGPGNVWTMEYYKFLLNKRKDAYMDVAVQVPILLGAQFGRFYFLAGAKADVSMMTKTRVSGEAETVGKFYGIDQEFRDMPEWGFYSGQEMVSKGSTSFRLNVNASLEIGARLGYIQTGSGFDVPKSKTQCRLAAFVDYGLLDIHKAQNKIAVQFPSEVDFSQAPKLQVADVLSTSDIAKAVNNLFVGIKFTVLFELPAPGTCVICRDGHLPFKSSGAKGRARIEED